MLLVPMMDGVAKYLSARYPVVQVVWARYCFHLLLLLPLVLRYHGVRALQPQRPALQLLRSGFLLGSTALFFGAIATIPIADALALVFISPFVVTALSAWLLRESVGARRWVAVAAGFVGALIIIRPGFGVFDWSSLLALGAGGCYACYIVTTRTLSAAGMPPLVTLAFVGLAGTVVMSVLVAPAWVTPSAADWGWMVTMGALAATVHYLITRALQHAPASLLAPYSYTEMISATAVGYLAFGDFPDVLTWVGVAVIIGSGIYISLRERWLARRRQLAAGRPPPAPSDAR